MERVTKTVKPDAEASRLTEELGTDGWVSAEPVVFRNSDLSTAVFEKCTLNQVNMVDCSIEGMQINGIPVMELMRAYEQSRASSVRVQVVEKPAFKAVGMKIRYEPSSGKISENPISQLWDRFMGHMWKIPHGNGMSRYGLKLIEPGRKPGEGFDYAATVEVGGFGILPEGMFAFEIPAATYARVTYRGFLDGLGSAYDHFWRDWLPNSGYERDHGVEFEYFDSRFQGIRNPESEMDLYFPVRVKP